MEDTITRDIAITLKRQAVLLLVKSMILPITKPLRACPMPKKMKANKQFSRITFSFRCGSSRFYAKVMIGVIRPDQ
jgi:hypothetical protein